MTITSTTTTATNFIHSDTISVPFDTEDVIMNSEEMTGSNVVITQDSMDAGASTVGLLLSQDTISSVEFDISQSRDNINSGDASSKLLRQVVSPVRPLNDADEVVVCTRQPPLPPPPLLVLCPNVNDVLFPMEGFTMWPGNMYCNSILQQLQSKYIASYNNKEGQAQIILEIIKMIQSQQHSSNVKDDDSCNLSCSKFLKAIQVPYRNKKQNQNSNHQSMDLQRFRVHDDRGEAIPSKTIWEVMRESDVVIELEKILEFRSESNHADATTNHNKNQAAENEESQIPASSMAILQGLYYVPNYYPSRTQKQSHEYGSGDEESVVSYDSSSEEDDDDIDDENGSMKIKRRRVIHRTMDDFKPTTKPSKASVSSNNSGKTDTKPTKKSIATQRVQHPPAVKVSMIGRITVDGDMHSSVASTGSSTTTPSVKVPIHSGGATTNKHHHQKVAFQYKPKSMTSHQAMIRQEGSDDLPKGVTVRPSGKWQAQTYFAGQSRYVGVYDTSRLAARAYNVVQDYLRKYRIQRKITKETPKEELTAAFATARHLADEAVQRLRRDLNMIDTVEEDEEMVSPIDNTISETFLSVSQENSPVSTNVTPPLEEPPSEKVTTADTTSQSTDRMDAPSKQNNMESPAPESSVSQVDTSTPQNRDGPSIT